jgi:hypothetical protein
VISETAQFDLEDIRKQRVASGIVDLLFFFKTGEGEPRNIVAQMRFVIEAYCTYTYPGFFDSGESLSSIVEKIRNIGEQHPACALLDELDDIHDYSREHCGVDDSIDAATGPLDIDELTDFVRRTLKIVNAIPDLP